MLKQNVPHLLSIGLLEHAQAVIDTAANEISFKTFGTKMPMVRLSSGHRALDIAQWDQGSDFEVPQEVLNQHGLLPDAFLRPRVSAESYTAELVSDGNPRNDKWLGHVGSGQQVWETTIDGSVEHILPIGNPKYVSSWYLGENGWEPMMLNSLFSNMRCCQQVWTDLTLQRDTRVAVVFHETPRVLSIPHTYHAVETCHATDSVVAVASAVFRPLGSPGDQTVGGFKTFGNENKTCHTSNPVDHLRDLEDQSGCVYTTPPAYQARFPVDQTRVAQAPSRSSEDHHGDFQRQRSSQAPVRTGPGSARGALASDGSENAVSDPENSQHSDGGSALDQDQEVRSSRRVHFSGSKSIWNLDTMQQLQDEAVLFEVWAKQPSEECSKGQEGSGLLGTAEGTSIPEVVSSRLSIATGERGDAPAGNGRCDAPTGSSVSPRADPGHVRHGDPFDATTERSPGDRGSPGPACARTIADASDANPDGSCPSDPSPGCRHDPGDTRGTDAALHAGWTGEPQRGAGLGNGGGPSRAVKISERNGIRSLSSILEESGVSQSNSMYFKDWFVSSLVDSVYGCPTFCSSGCSFLWKPSLTNPQTFAIWKDSELLRKLEIFSANDDHDFQVRSRDKRSLVAAVEQLLAEESPVQINQSEMDPAFEETRAQLQALLQDVWSKRTASGEDARTSKEPATGGDGKTPKEQTATDEDGRTSELPEKQTATDQDGRTSGKFETATGGDGRTPSEITSGEGAKTSNYRSPFYRSLHRLSALGEKSERGLRFRNMEDHGSLFQAQSNSSG